MGVRGHRPLHSCHLLLHRLLVRLLVRLLLCLLLLLPEPPLKVVLRLLALRQTDTMAVVRLGSLRSGG
jgi:hypothetical protein